MPGRMNRHQGRGLMQDGGGGLQNGRAGEFYAHGNRLITGLYMTPLYPPKGPARVIRQTCRINRHTSPASDHSTAGRAPGQPAPATAHSTATTKGTSQRTAQHHSRHQHHTQPKATATDQTDRRAAPTATSGQPDDGPEGRRYSRRVFGVCGFESAEFF